MITNERILELARINDLHEGEEGSLYQALLFSFAKAIESECQQELEAVKAELEIADGLYMDRVKELAAAQARIQELREELEGIKSFVCSEAIPPQVRHWITIDRVTGSRATIADKCDALLATTDNHAALDAAIAAEREECAKICDYAPDDCASRAAETIRTRTKP